MINFLIGLMFLFTTIGLYYVAIRFNHRYPSPFSLPILTTTLVLAAFLLVSGISYETYMIGGQWLDYLLGPVVVSLGYPLYKQKHILKTYIVPISIGVCLGSVIGIISGVFMAKILQFKQVTLYSIASKNVTTPVSMDIATTIGGAPSLAAAFVMFAGIGGAVFGLTVLRFVQIDNPIARGIGMGTASHAIGTARMMENSEMEGAVSTVSMTISAMLVAIITPIIVQLFF
ncbi:LrgB family protein [Aquibacillus albus]|uniref:Murein hydrolase (TIGR00659 family) n=1 Tax=Aquibacillus albus TaxID=1168171 RepID=A0ABS2N2T0_9BACI|nr:LrgB family protein [Aquibacillus albus]MBM7572458.1 putative murein hydrolase (TIGR00659 family) [Aquibacillus albus]